MDDVAIVIVQHHHITVAGGGLGGETAGLISVYLASHTMAVYVEVVDAAALVERGGGI